jgi:hypothetical protein
VQQIHPEARTEQGEGHQQQQHARTSGSSPGRSPGWRAKISMAMVATMKISTPWAKSTSISSRSVLKMNRNGSAAVRRL